MSRGRAFTLVELLVVIVIVAILFAILFPVLAQAKDAAKKATCFSNLRQISKGLLLYTDDYDDYLCPYFNPGGPGLPARFWFGSAISVGPMPWPVNVEDSLIFPYIGSGKILDCYAAADLPVNSSYYIQVLAYGVNQSVINNGIATPASRVEVPSETFSIADAAWLPYGEPRIARPLCLYKTYFGANTPYFHGRHTGDTAIVGWVDGHATARKPDYRPFDHLMFGVTKEMLRGLKLGDLLKYPRKAIAAGTMRVEDASDWYYHDLSKPKY